MRNNAKEVVLIKKMALTICLGGAFFITWCLVWPLWPHLAGFLSVNDPLRKADVVVALAGGSERAPYAAELYLKGLAPRVIMTGCGSSAKQMAIAAVVRGVNPGDIIIEGKAESTYENALYTREIIVAANFRSAIIVTSPYHARRTKLVFDRLFRNTGVKLLYSTAPGSGFNENGLCCSPAERQVVCREYIKLVYYWFKYWQ